MALRWAVVLFLVGGAGAWATPANRAALGRYYDRFLPAELNRCTTCHLPSDLKDPASLEEFPHNALGDRLRVLGEEAEKAGKRRPIADRLAAVAGEDSDGDGVANELEILAGANPGDAKARPAEERSAGLGERAAEWAKFLASYRWQPFERVERPAVPAVKDAAFVRNPVDAFIAAEHAARGLTRRPPAAKATLLRRVYLDLIGLSPTPAEQKAFAEDTSPDAYEKVVDRLLGDPRHGERWARHWMDIWRYSDWAGWTDGKQVRDSQRHIWRWRDWIVGALNSDRGYDRMVIEMLAGDEVAPNDPATLPATGFLVRNYKMLSREQWLEDTVKHTAQAFLGVTLGCAKCHDHRADPITQAEYYQVRAIFEPHKVRADRVPGELDLEKDGLPRVYDAEKDAKTYFLIRGDERTPDKERALAPGVPRALTGSKLSAQLAIQPVALPREAVSPDDRDFVIEGLLAASAGEITSAEEKLKKFREESPRNEGSVREWELVVAAKRAADAALKAVLRTEALETSGKKDSAEWMEAARDAAQKQREAAFAEAVLGVHQLVGVQGASQTALAKAKDGEVKKAQTKLDADVKKTGEAIQKLAKAGEQLQAEPTTAFTVRKKEMYPAESTGRRRAFAEWIAHRDNPLAARVAVNHLLLRHFGRGIVATPENLGSDGARPSHPALLDWLAAEFMEGGWKMKAIHRLIVTSNTYCMASTPDETSAALDPDNEFLWRMPTRRMEAEVVRDNLLYVSGSLDLTAGGPEIDHTQGLTSKRRSLYFRSAAEKEMEFLKIFDGPNVTECYQRRPSVMPQQSLALANSELPLAQAKVLAKTLAEECGSDDRAFAEAAFLRVLARAATEQETAACVQFLAEREPAGADAKGAPAQRHRARENLVLVLFNHHDFVTIR